jgi:hypothetical protein
MHFFLYEIVARIIATYLCVDCGRKLRNGFVERKIAIYNSDLLDWWSYPPVHRDAAPVRYWIEMGIQTIALVACFVVAIFGWFQPNG